VNLDFDLKPEATSVRSKVTFRKKDLQSDAHDLVLDGIGLQLVSVKIDGVSIDPDTLSISEEKLVVPAALLPRDEFLWECEVLINPKANTALEGLYMSKGMYCSQCEAEGFRKITYYPDRPDVLAPFSVRVSGPEPVLLSNGNLTQQGDGYADWTDPHPKPAYLFALVAGDLVSYDDSFTTMSGRKVQLRIFVREGDRDRCAYAMDALKRSMLWDEEVYGREYDLDIFMIVAVDDFNMGAMENKGLNIFNSKYVLASPETATDTDYELIEAIIAHEYFHNWTGNRITCRDWFQLSLKEGLTVYRDQSFSADMRSAAVQRIKDVKALRARQFREDAGPLAHPVRPESYVEINNFYTATVYEKGAEVIRMLATLVGPKAYRKALDLYFDRHDGQACTIEDWLQVFEDTTGRDLTQFKRWYTQAGTPVVTVSDKFKNGVYTLSFKQELPQKKGDNPLDPYLIPISYGFVGEGNAQAGVLELDDTASTFDFEFAKPPTASLLRHFSAPVSLEFERSDQALAEILANDDDLFCRWEAGRTLALQALEAMATDAPATPQILISAMHRTIANSSVDPAFRALLLNLPGEDEIAARLYKNSITPDPDKIHAARQSLITSLADKMRDDLSEIYHEMTTTGPYKPDADDAARRSLRASALSYLTKLDPKANLARAQYQTADNMTETLSALSALVGAGAAEAELADFKTCWRDDPNVLDKWFKIQMANTPPDHALAQAIALSKDDSFGWKTPNRFISLVGAFTSNSVAFHAKDGSGYEFVADWLLKMDPVNPQTAARLSGTFETWSRYDDLRKSAAVHQLERILSTKNLSKDTNEMVTRIKGAA